MFEDKTKGTAKWRKSQFFDVLLIRDIGNEAKYGNKRCNMAAQGFICNFESYLFPYVWIMKIKMYPYQSIDSYEIYKTILKNLK